MVKMPIRSFPEQRLARVALLLATLLSGCAFIERAVTPTYGPVDKVGQDAPGNGLSQIRETSEQEREALLDQPYIDPLTNYLRKHQNDTTPPSILSDVRRERDARCDAIARDYQTRAATEDNLQNYRAGYDYSCPQDVAAFAERVNTRTSEPELAQAAEEDQTEAAEAQRKALSDCYLLTSIKNFSAASKVCSTPAENGDTRAQASMGMIAYAFEKFDEALVWARHAAPESADASYLLGRLYERGKVVEVDRKKAAYWYQQAVDGGHRDAQGALQRLSSVAEPDDG